MKDLNRRDFLKVAGFTAAGLVTTRMSYAADPQQAAPPLGKSVMDLSPLNSIRFELALLVSVNEVMAMFSTSVISKVSK